MEAENNVIPKVKNQYHQKILDQNKIKHQVLQLKDQHLVLIWYLRSLYNSRSQRFSTCSSPWQISHSVGISSIPGYLLQRKFHLYSSMQVSWSLSTWSLSIPHNASRSLPMKITNVAFFTTLKPAPGRQYLHFQVLLPVQWVAWPLDFSSIGISVLPPRNTFLSS